MKKLILTFTAAAILLTSCAVPVTSSKSTVSSAPQDLSSQSVSSMTSAEKTSFNIAGLKGPTTMGLVKLMSDAENGIAKHNYNVSMYGAAEEITAKITKGELDAAIVPCNLASILFNKTNGEIVTAAINNTGVLYMVSSADIKSVQDLKGTTIYTTGKGTTPEYILNYILEKNGLAVGTDVMVEYKSEATEVAASMNLSSGYPVAMLPQPYVTSFLSVEGSKFKIVLDMNEEWAKVSKDSQIVTGVLVARKEFIQNNKEAFDEFLQEYKQSCEYTAENTSDTAQLCEKYGIVAKAALAEKALPFCNINYMDGADMKVNINAYLAVLFNQNPQSVGGTLPNDEFYYKK